MLFNLAIHFVDLFERLGLCALGVRFGLMLGLREILVDRINGAVELGSYRLANLLALVLVVGAVRGVADLAANLGGGFVGVALKLLLSDLRGTAG